ncbi:hypothetical protein D3C85_1047590 [compost metagenome]
MVGGIHDVDGYTYVPIALGRAVAALDVRLELYREPQVAQDLLELLLLAVAAVDGIGIGFDNLPALADIGPQGGVVEVAAIRLTHGVVEVLDIGEHRYFFHRTPSLAPRRSSWPLKLRADSAPSMPASR